MRPMVQKKVSSGDLQLFWKSLCLHVFRTAVENLLVGFIFMLEDLKLDRSKE
uniref:Uncharacterized protein n=1 Tax=Arundo donax TaxID=35708 RepID=A0A0A9GXU8_ARUDO